MAVPIQEHGFALYKSAFRDAVALRYGWDPDRLPSHCACGSNFSVDYALSCNNGGFPSLQNNEIRDLTASLVSEVCSNVHIRSYIHSTCINQSDNSGLSKSN